MRSMGSRRTAATRSTTVTRLYAVGTGGCGNESVTATPQSTHSAKSAKRRGCCDRWRRYTTGCRWQRAGRMTRETSCRCASPAMQGFMQSVATAGRKSNRQETPQRWNCLPVPYFLKRSECEPVSIKVSVKISSSMR